jgi:uncharacterized iron-regulated protein
MTSPCRRGVEDRSGACGEKSRLRIPASAWLLASVIGVLVPAPFARAAEAETACKATANWVDVKTGNAVQGNALLRDVVAKNAIVVLGESHTDADHHRWQLQTLAGLYGRTGKMAIGFEAFPRRLQGVLDDWVAGKLSADAFLKASDWRRVWGYDAALYMPMFQFARLNRIPMIALNVERTLVSKVGRDGWASVPGGEREGLTKPAPASTGYQRELARVYQMKTLMATAQPGGAIDPASPPIEGADVELDEKTFADVLREPEFQRFVDAQQTWDRAMAEALAAGQRKFPGATVVGIAGVGHVEGGYGIPHQLKDLGVAEVASFIPAGTDEACKLVGTGYADAMFTLAPTSDAAPERPRLGVLLADGEGGGARIDQVVPKSVAEATGLKAGDNIVRAAGLEMRNSGDVVDVVAVQAPGTWLPLGIRRDDQEIEMIAKFPPRPRQEP